MNREWLVPAKILTGICVLAVSSFSQTYTVSAKPGAVNYIQGEVTVNGDPVWTSNLKSTFLGPNDVIAVKNGRAEVLLTPGVFLRLGENSQVRMIKPSLVETQLEIMSGESMIEVDDLVPGSGLAVMDHGSSTTLIKTGLYRFSERSIATLEGKAEVALGDQKVDLKKNKEVQLDSDKLTARKIDLTKGDDLYAWSNTRAQYNAAATYAGSRQAYDAGGYGYSSFSSPGWYWNSPFSSYMWMPGNGAFYSPFGWGFYGPGVVQYAPVIGLGYGNGYYGNYYGNGGYYRGSPATGTTAGAVKNSPVVAVPINPNNPPVSGFQGSSPAAFASARSQVQQYYANTGLRTANGAPAANLRSGQTYSNMRSASQAASSSAHSMAASPSYSGGGNARSGYSGGGSASSASPRSSGPSGMGSMGRSSAGAPSGGNRGK